MSQTHEVTKHSPTLDIEQIEQSESNEIQSVTACPVKNLPVSLNRKLTGGQMHPAQRRAIFSQLQRTFGNRQMQNALKSGQIQRRPPDAGVTQVANPQNQPAPVQAQPQNLAAANGSQTQAQPQNQPTPVPQWATRLYGQNVTMDGEVPVAAESITLPTLNLPAPPPVPPTPATPPPTSRRRAGRRPAPPPPPDLLLARHLPASAAFGGLPEVEQFARQLANIYASRRAASIVAQRNREALEQAERNARRQFNRRMTNTQRQAALEAARQAAPQVTRAQVETELSNERFQWLQNDFAESRRAAARRIANLGAERFLRAWMVMRREQTEFDTYSNGSPSNFWANARDWFARFPRPARPASAPRPAQPARQPGQAAPPPAPETFAQRRDRLHRNIHETLRNRLVEIQAPGHSSEGYLVQPELNSFLRNLVTACQQNNVTLGGAGTYGNHGGGAFANAGLSIDLEVAGGTDTRGFFRRNNALRFLRAINQAAQATSVEWHALYNDFSVARAYNQEAGSEKVGFVANVDAGGNLNWHGPLNLHFHLDILPASLNLANPAQSAAQGGGH